VIVKPVAEGSSIGVAIVKRGEELAAAVSACLADNGTVLVEAFKQGREVTTGVLGTGTAARPCRYWNWFRITSFTITKPSIRRG
jgi:D-alanine-D-alanine ligase-like ATP-grasp enzyme